MKHTITFFAVLMMTLAIPQNVRAYVFSFTYQGKTLYYNIVDGHAEVVRLGTGNSYNNYVTGDVVIPSTVSNNGSHYSVTALTGTFEGCSGLTSVIIPNSVTSIGSNAFQGCSGLTSVIIPNSVTSIGYSAFGGCSGLTSVTIPNSVTSIGSNAFQGCSGLTSITISNSVTNIGQYAFSGCSGLTSVTIGNSVTSIGNYAFRYCSGLSTVNFNATNCTTMGSQNYPVFEGCTNLAILNIGENVTQIPDYAFRNCSGLTTVNFNATNCTAMGSIGSSVFYGCTNFMTLNIGENVIQIPSHAFRGCSGLTSVTIPNSVTSIGDEAFYNCSGLTSITVATGNTNYDSRNNCNAIIETADNRLIVGCQTTVIPNSVTSIGNYAFYNCSDLTVVTIPNSVTSIGYCAFSGCSGLTSVTIPNSVTSIGSGAFGGCSSLTSVTIPNSVTSIGDFAFSNCSGLTSVTIPNSVNSIGEWAFKNCSGLTSVTIPNSVTSIGEGAFENCSGLTSVTIPNSVTSIGEGAFRNCIGLTTVNFNATNCATIGSNSYPVFSGCTNFETLNIGENVIQIPNDAFRDYSGLTSVSIGNSVTSIGNYAFRGCSGLTSVTIPNSVTSIGNYAFQNCSGLTSVTIPNSVTIIGDFAFYNCSGLTSVTIGNSVTSIGDYAFYSCSVLMEITSRAITSPTLASNIWGVSSTFSGVSSTIPVYIPCGSLASYQTTWSYFSNLILPPSPYSINVGVTDSTFGVSNVTDGPACDSTAVIEAVANYGYHFDHWSNGSTANPDTITLVGDSSVTAYFAPNTYAIVGNTNDSVRGFVMGSDMVEYLDSVTLTATANYGYHFSQWSDGNTDNPRLVQVLGNAAYTAQFDFNQYDITLDVDISIHGTCSGSGRYSYLSNRTITANANYGYHFTQWNDGNTDNPRTLSLTQDTSFIAYFAPNQYNITGTSADEARGSVTGGNTVDYLDTVILTATANYGYHFTRWQDYNTNNPRSIQVTQNKTYTAYFDFNQYSITLGVDTNIHGAVSGGGNYNFLSNRTITATPNYGYHFTQWNDGDTNNPRVLTLTQDTAFTALFTKNTYTITAISNDTIRGVVTGSTLTEYHDSVTIVAIPNYGYHFTAWNDGDTTNPRTIETIKDSLFTAYFDYDQYSITLNVDTNIHGLVTGGGLYNYISEQTIAATANYGYHFTAWNDGDTTNPRIITLTQDTSFTALFAKNTYTLTGLSADTIRGSVSGSTTMEYLDSVSIAATANYGYHFTQWNDGDTINPRVITLTQDTVITAYFAKNWYVVFGTSDNETMGYVSGSDTVEYLDSVSLSATSNYGYHFSSWNDGDTNNPRVVCITQDTTFTALFAKNQYTLTVQSNDETQGSVSDGGVFEYLDTASIIASANEHYHFVRWDDGNTDNPREYVIVGDATLTAIFAIDTHTVTVTTNDIARGMVEATGSEFSYGTPCTVTATAYTGYVFSHWSNGITANPYTFAVLEDTELIAIFEEEGAQGIDDVDNTDNIRIFSKYDRIIIDGLNGQDVTIYTIDGRTIASLPRATEHVAIPITTTGVYIVKIGAHPARKAVVIR